MAQTVVDLTLGTIRDLLVEEVKFLFGVEGQLKDVQTELRILQSRLEEVDRRKSEDRQVLNFVKQIRSLCYGIEDVVDTYVAEEVLRKRGKGIMKILERIACLLCEWKSIHEVGKEIAGIKGQISSLTARMESYGILKSSLERRQLDDDDETRGRRRQTYGIGVGEEKDFVGMTKNIALLVAELLKDAKVSKNRVVSICGMGGLGKTALAEKIYHHKDIRREFETFAWVCVSQNCKPEVLFRDLLGQLNPSKKDTMNNLGDSELVREVYEALKSHKCLVVLDDVWALEDWRWLEQAFQRADANSKVLITTRKESVARVGGFIYHPTVLSEDEAWTLLQKKAFIGGDCKDFGTESNALEQLGREMVHKCGYLPLAISVLGGILSEKKSFDEWESINKKINVYMRAVGSIKKEIEGVLSLSYDDLPSHLKPCFLYLSRFPEDESISIEQLCFLLIYEGLVSPQDQEKGETLRDVALGYLNELASRSLVQLQVSDRFVIHDEQRFRVHDFFRDLSLEKSKEEEFLNVMDFRGGNCPSINPSSTTSCIRRLAIYVDQDLDFVLETPESSQSLRSLFLRATRGFKISNTSIFAGPKGGLIDFNKSNLVRVLYFENVDFEGNMLPAEMSKLIHLKLLGFNRCWLLELPSWVGDLPFLQALILSIYTGEIKIPNVFWKIKGLKVLHLPDYYIVGEEKLVFDGLNELETLYGVISKTCEITSLSKLKNLRRLKLSIEGNDNLSKFIDSMEASVQHLDHTEVRVRGCDFGSEEGMSLLKKVFKSNKIFSLHLEQVMPVHMSKLPNYEPCFFPNLVELELVGGEIREDPMGTLEKLSNLRKLVLISDSFVGQQMVCHANGFPQLRDLELLALTNLEKWKVEKGAMPCLSYLDLAGCDNLEMIPDGIRFITTLHTLDISGMHEEFRKRVEEGGEDFHKVSHVNSIK